MSTYKFPDNFKWGSATSSHQIEGDNHNDWSEWEKSESRLESLTAKGLDPTNYISGKACDSFNRYEEDFNIAKELNHNIHRLSIEWSRIEPEEGRFDPVAMQHYKNVVKSLRDRGIEPMVTLWHFTNPAWFAEKGGFINLDSSRYFTRYAKYVVENLKDQVGLWITFNEATTVYSSFGYLKALWPPQHKSIREWRRINSNIVKAHIRAYKEIKKVYSNHSPVNFDNKNKPTAGLDASPATNSVMSHNVRVGFAESNAYVPDAKSWLGTWLRRRYKSFRNFYFSNKSAPYYDFIGLNYYHMDKRPSLPESSETIPKQPLNKDMGWEMYPPGIYHCLLDLKKYGKPIFITENGTADSTDESRAKYIKDHLFWTYKAIQDGADVRGYLYWSLLDNFEWHHGYGPRFGLVEIDYKTFERRIRSSAREYAKICRENQLENDL